VRCAHLCLFTVEFLYLMCFLLCLIVLGMLTLADPGLGSPDQPAFMEPDEAEPQFRSPRALILNAERPPPAL
jgi:hypothetical protein